MSLPVSCPGCQAVYPVPESLIGKTIRCKKCGEMMPVKAPAQPVAADIIEDDDPPPAKPTRRREEADAPKAKATRRPRVEDDDEDDEPKPLSKRRPAAAVADTDEEDEDDDDRPTRKAGGKSKLPLIVGGSVAALLLVGGIVAAVMFGGGDKPDDKPLASNTTPAVVPGPSTVPNTNPDPKPEPKPEPKPDKPEPQPALRPDEVKPRPEDTKTAVTPMKVAPTPPVEPDLAVTGRGSSGRGSSGGASGLSAEAYFNGNIPKLTMEQTLKASVFIRTDMDNGYGTGSGWFGVAPGLVFTNAHVLGMKAPNSPEPKKLTFYLNAGTAQQREIPHAKLKILAVDRDIDLAVIQVVGESDLPTPLKIKLSSEMELGQSVYTVGYPLGYILSQLAKSKKEPEVTVRKTSFIGISTNEYGQIRRVKLESGVNSGNSGGPVVDANGAVSAVVVAITNVPGTGNAISLCVPTEYVDGLMSGRVSDVEYGVPYRDQDKVKIPITANVLNPMDRKIIVRVQTWVGDANAKYRTPTLAKPVAEANDADVRDVELKYDEKAKKATGELVYTNPPAGRTYWAQPYYLNDATVHTLPGVRVPVNGPPVERVAANLTAVPKEGARRVVTMSNSSSTTEEYEGEGEAKSDRVLIKRTLKVTEQVVKPDRSDTRQIARLQLQFDSFNFSAEMDGVEEQIIPKKELDEMAQFFKQATAFGLINKFGEMYNYTLTINGIKDAIVNLIISSISNNALEAMQATSIPMPNKMMNPLETWETTKEMRYTMFSRPKPGMVMPGGTGAAAKQPTSREYKYRDQVTYTYLGMRERAGRKEAVVSVSGKSLPAAGTKEAVKGSLKGIVWVEVETGVVVQAELEKEFELDTSRDGQKKKLSVLNTFKIDRGSAQ